MWKKWPDLFSLSEITDEMNSIVYALIPSAAKTKTIR